MSLSFYDLMDKLDKFTLNNADAYDFRELTVHSNKINEREFLFIKSNADIVCVIDLTNTGGKIE